MGVITWEGLWGLQGRLGASGELLASLPAHNGAAQLEPDFSARWSFLSVILETPAPPGPAPSQPVAPTASPLAASIPARLELRYPHPGWFSGLSAPHPVAAICSGTLKVLSP